MAGGVANHGYMGQACLRMGLTRLPDSSITYTMHGLQSGYCTCIHGYTYIYIYIYALHGSQALYMAIYIYTAWLIGFIHGYIYTAWLIGFIHGYIYTASKRAIFCPTDLHTDYMEAGFEVVIVCDYNAHIGLGAEQSPDRVVGGCLIWLECVIYV